MKDKVIEKLIKAETKRQNETLNLIPSENLKVLLIRDSMGIEYGLGLHTN